MERQAQGFFNLHQVISEYKTEQEEKNDSDGYYRMPSELKSEVTEVLRTNGISMSKFIRGCCHRLVHEYKHPVEVR